MSGGFCRRCLYGELLTSAYVSIRQHTSAYVSIRQHTSAYVSIRCLLGKLRDACLESQCLFKHICACVSLQRH